MEQYTIILHFDLESTKEMFIEWWNNQGAKLTAHALTYTTKDGLVFEPSLYNKEENEIFISAD